jgi:hypothetical protein
VTTLAELLLQPSRSCCFNPPQSAIHGTVASTLSNLPSTLIDLSSIAECHGTKVGERESAKPMRFTHACLQNPQSLFSPIINF